MALSKIEFTKGSGGLARKSASLDGISGLLFYQTVPSGFSSDAVQQVFSLTEAEQLGLTAEDEPVIHYHVSEFFRAQKGGSLHIGIYAEPTPAHDFIEVADMQTLAEGEIKQLGIHTQKAFIAAQVTALQGVLDALSVQHMPLSAVLVADLSGLTLSALPNLRTSQAGGVSVVIGQDAGGVGASLYTSEGYTIGVLGALIGAVAKSSVHESISWVGKFNMGGAELDVIGFGEGTAVRGVTTAQLEELDNKGYIFLQKHVGISGSYFNGSWTASNDDYDTIEKNRAIDKAIRGLRAALLPSLSAPLYVNPTTGKLSEDTIQAFTNEAYRPVGRMADIGELSGARVFIDPDQNVLDDDTLELVAELVPVGVSRIIKVKIGYTVKLSTAQ